MPIFFVFFPQRDSTFVIPPVQTNTQEKHSADSTLWHTTCNPQTTKNSPIHTTRTSFKFVWEWNDRKKNRLDNKPNWKYTYTYPDNACLSISWCIGKSKFQWKLFLCRLPNTEYLAPNTFCLLPTGHHVHNNYSAYNKPLQLSGLCADTLPCILQD